MNLKNIVQTMSLDPIDALLSQHGESVLAVITEIDGPSYRPLGATMAVFEDKQCVGTLSSGCIEADIALHALEALADNETKRARYGRGSPFMDIKLPCGGGLEILLIPNPDKQVLNQLAERRHARIPCTLSIEPENGTLSLKGQGNTGHDNGLFNIRFLPEIRFLVFGKGPEAGTFAALVQSAGYPNTLLSPDNETLDHGKLLGCETRHLATSVFPANLEVDPWTAVVLFFHDHEWEPPILKQALSGPAFYIGAQGSRKARDVRNMELEMIGIGSETLSRVRGPIGLIPSVRDGRVLAVSVLAEILAVEMETRNIGKFN